MISVVLYFFSEVSALVRINYGMPHVWHISFTYIFSLAKPALLCVAPPPSLVLPPSPLTPPPLSLGLLCPPALPHASSPPALAANIARRDKDVGNPMGGGEARWSTAGGSALRGKFPSRPLAVVGDGISRPPFLHQPNSSTHCTVRRHSDTCTPWQIARGGAGKVPGATVAPLDWLTDLYNRQTIYRRTYTKPPSRSFSLPFLPSR